MTKTENFAQLEVTSVGQLRAWLEAHHAQDEAVWLVTFKKEHADTYVSREAVLDELLCFGWIDGVRRKLDVDRTMQLIAPRRTQRWAKSYKDRVARLEREGRMHAAGRQSVEVGKRSGLWDAFEDVDALVVPDDLVAALAAHPPAAEHFAAFAPSYRRNVLRWIAIAKGAATRAKRIETVATLAVRNEKVPQY